MSENNKSFFAKIKVQSWFLPLLLIVVGIFFVFVPETSISLICKAIAVGLIALGALLILYYFITKMKFNSKTLIAGAIALGLGIFFFKNYKSFTGIIITVLGILLIADGVTKLQSAYDSYRLRIKGWGLLLTFAIITIAGGIVMIIKPFDSTKVFFIFIGVILIYQGLIDFLNNNIYVKEIKKKASDYKEIQKERREEKRVRKENEEKRKQEAAQREEEKAAQKEQEEKEKKAAEQKEKDK